METFAQSFISRWWGGWGGGELQCDIIVALLHVHKHFPELISKNSTQNVFIYLSLFVYNSCEPPSAWFTITVSCEYLQLMNIHNKLTLWMLTSLWSKEKVTYNWVHSNRAAGVWISDDYQYQKLYQGVTRIVSTPTWWDACPLHFQVALFQTSMLLLITQ